MKCRICSNTELKLFLSLGRSPLANSFLKKEELNKEEPFYPLDLYFCEGCKLVQLGYVVPHNVMFKEYVYVSSTTNTFRAHFSKMANDLSNYFKLNDQSLVVDVGSNDGLLLSGFKKFGIKVIGVEPATNIAEIAEKNGIETINDFFNSPTAKKIIEKKGNADVITANNVFAHVDNINDFIKNVKLLLKKEGVFVIEVQYLIDMIEKMTFDNIYHEHLSYFSLTSLVNFFKLNGMEVFDAQKVDTHGGSLRVFTKKTENQSVKVKDSVTKILDHEKNMGINDLEIYKNFADKVKNVKEKLLNCLKELKTKGKSVVGYGAPAKSSTLLNFCQIGTDYIDYIIEDNPLKIGLFSPGTHIPLMNSSSLDQKNPDYILILAWNFADEILSKTKKYADKGVRFIIPLPDLFIR